VKEDGFTSVYEPYCANITHAADIILVEEGNLSVSTALQVSAMHSCLLQSLNFIIDVSTELPALILAPSHRLYSYPIILEVQGLATGSNDD
jgi:cell division control protein 24